MAGDERIDWRHGDRINTGNIFNPGYFLSVEDNPGYMRTVTYSDNDGTYRVNEGYAAAHRISREKAAENDARAMKERIENRELIRQLYPQKS